MKLLEFKEPKLLYFEKLLPLCTRDAQSLTPLSLRSKIFPQNPEAVSFFLNPENALQHWAQDIKLEKNDLVGLINPYPSEFKKILQFFGAQIQDLPNDPDELYTMDLSPLKAVLLSNPNLANSFYFPNDIYSKIITHLLSFPKLQILSEESLFEFYCQSDYPDPGSAKNFMHKNLSILSGSYSFSSDNNAWLIKHSSNPIHQDISLRASPICAQSLLTLKEARSFKQFSQRLLVMEHNLIRLVNDLRPAMSAGLIKVLHWPKPRAVYLMIDISQVLNHEGLTTEEWVEKLQIETGISVAAGTSFGSPCSIRICLAYGYKHLQEVTKLLNNYLVSRL